MAKVVAPSGAGSLCGPAERGGPSTTDAGWSAPSIATDEFNALSGTCISGKYCVVFDSHGRKFVYNSKRWEQQQFLLDPVPTVRGCASRTVWSFSNFPDYPGEVVTVSTHQNSEVVMAALDEVND